MEGRAEGGYPYDKANGAKECRRLRLEESGWSAHELASRLIYIFVHWSVGNLICP